MASILPTTLKPELIGEVVALQYWDKNHIGKLDADSFSKIVGTLEGYIQTPKGFTITFVGMHGANGFTKLLKYENEYYEVFLYKKDGDG